MVFEMTSVWKRKVIQYSDQQALESGKVISGMHPYTVVSDPEFSAEYARIYGQAELDILKKSCSTGKYNMVESRTQEWVQGGTYVAAPPKPEAVLQPGMVWQETPFGRRQVPAGTATTNLPIAVAELSALIKQELSAIVYDAVRKAFVSLAD